MFHDRSFPHFLPTSSLGQRHHREGTTPEETRSTFAELFRLLGQDEHVRDLDLLFCGPNIAPRLHDTLHSFPCFHTPAEKEQGQVGNTTINLAAGDADDGGHQDSTPSALAVKLRYNSGLYHDVSELFPAPNALFLFNAGLWGYDDWIPTIEHVLGCGCNRSNGAVCHSYGGDNGDVNRPPLVVTSYCPEEASDDMETIQKVVLDSDERCQCLVVGGLEWMWEPEENPHRSLVPRPTKCGVEGIVLFENQSWQALRRPFGVKAPRPGVAAET